ncbi:MAG: replication initiator protein A [Evtepia gabavorous]
MKDYPYPMQARNEALCPFTRDTQLSGFLTLPKSLLCWGLSPGALLVYGLLLDRGKLSQRSGWTDKQGWVYVIFPVRELALALGKGVTTIKRWLRELEERELIFRTVPFQGEAGWIFLRVPRYGVEGEREKALGLPPPAPAVRDPWEERAGRPGGRAGPHRRRAGCWRRWSGAAGSFPQPRPVPAPGRLRANPVQSRTGRGRIWP